MQPPDLSGSRSYLSSDTIFSRISGSGGAVILMRISGPLAATALDLMVGGGFSAQAHPRMLKLVKLKDSRGRAVDQAMVVFFEEGASFTGEAVVELHLHGGTIIQAQVAAELRRLGCRQALPGEFSFRAVRNGKLTLDQAQGVRDLIEAGSRSAHAVAMERLSGTPARAFESCAETLRQALTLAEAGIDFSDQDLDELSVGNLQARVKPVQEFLDQLDRTLERGLKIREGLTVVLAGLPNAGKSTLFNELLGLDRSLISEEAGTTRDVLREPLRISMPSGDSDFAVMLHDTAGLREEAGRIESLGIERTLEASRSADWVLFVVELESELEASVHEWHRLGVSSRKAILVVTKSETWVGAARQREWLEALERRTEITGHVLISAKTGLGIQKLVSRMGERCAELGHRSEGEFVLTRADQQDAVRKARESLGRALASTSHELLASDLRQALEHLSFFIGKTAPDEILGRIFSQFCIGK